MPEVEDPAYFERVSQPRDEVDRWATRAMQCLEFAEVDETIWWALGMLSGIDHRPSNSGRAPGRTGYHGDFIL
ncbi:hypothetical protein [Micromonospora sonchi]|nr:hypothetical protein [Micromonospora sonchi]